MKVLKTKYKTYHERVALTTIVTGTALTRVTKFHMDGREMHGKFEVLSKTKGGRYRIRITRDMVNGNDYTKPFWQDVEETTISFSKMLKLQFEFGDPSGQYSVIELEEKK